MKLFTLLALTSSIVGIYSHIDASAPAHQTMEQTISTLVNENKELQKTKTTLLAKLQVLQQPQQPKYNCCDKLGECCDTLGDKCGNVGERTDNWCTQWIGERYGIVTCQTNSDNANCLGACAALITGSTCFLPCNIVRGIFCSTTYVCCDAKCSKKCLGLRD